MNHHSPLLIGSILAMLAASPILAQQQQRGGGLAPECRQEIMTLCGQDRAERRACMKEKAAELSDGCKAELRKRMETRKARRQQGSDAPAPVPAPVPTAAPTPEG